MNTPDRPESKSAELRRLNQESSRWFEQERGRSYYMHECPGASTEHNREIRISQLGREIGASSGNDSYPDNEG